MLRVLGLNTCTHTLKNALGPKETIYCHEHFSLCVTAHMSKYICNFTAGVDGIKRKSTESNILMIISEFQFREPQSNINFDQEI